MPVEILGFWRLTVSTLLILCWILLKKKTWPKLNRHNLVWVVISGVLFFLHIATYTYAAKNTTISNTVIFFASNPIWASMGAILFFQEKLSPRVVISYVLAVAAIYTLVRSQIRLDGQTVNGDVAAILSALFYAAFILASKKGRQYFDTTVLAFSQYTVGALCFAAWAVPTANHFTGYSGPSWGAILGLIALPTLLGHMTLTHLVRTMDLTVISCGKLVEPVIASVISYFIFQEKLKEAAGISFGLTAASVFILFAPGLWYRLKKIKYLGVRPLK